MKQSKRMEYIWIPLFFGFLLVAIIPLIRENAEEKYRANHQVALAGTAYMLDGCYIQLGMIDKPMLPRRTGELYQLWSDKYNWVSEAYADDGTVAGYYYEVPLHMPENSSHALRVFSPKDLREYSNQMRDFKGILWSNDQYNLHTSNGAGIHFQYQPMWGICLYEAVDGSYPAQVQEEFEAWWVDYINELKNSMSISPSSAHDIYR